MEVTLTGNSMKCKTCPHRERVDSTCFICYLFDTCHDVDEKLICLSINKYRLINEDTLGYHEIARDGEC